MKLHIKLFLFTVMTLLLVSVVTASSVTITPLNSSSNYVYFDESAQYEISITNTQGIDQVFSWSVNPVEWVTETATSVRIPAGETQTFPLTIRARPTNYKGPGFYVIPVTIRSNTESFNEQTTIYIKSVHDGGYLPSVEATVIMNSEVDPRQPVSVQVNLRNRNILEIKDMNLTISSLYFSGSFKVNLGGLEEKTLEYRFDVDPLTRPGTSNLTLTLDYDNDRINEVNKFFDIGAYSSIQRNTKPSSSFLFRYVDVSTLTNVANINKTVSLDLAIPWYERIFTDVNIQSTGLEKVGVTSWDATLVPQETATVTVVKNYRSIPIALILLLIVVILYFSLRSPIVLRKQSIVTGQDMEGVNEMKVRVYIRNRTGRGFFNVRVLDRVPAIAHVKVGTGLGVLEPSDVVRTDKKGTIIKWDFDTIESFEERIVTYTIKVKLKVTGPLSLPPVKCKFENVKGKQRTIESGKAEIGTTSK